MPRTEIRFDEKYLGITRNEILRQLAAGEPSIDIAGGRRKRRTDKRTNPHARRSRNYRP